MDFIQRIWHFKHKCFSSPMRSSASFNRSRSTVLIPKILSCRSSSSLLRLTTSSFLQTQLLGHHIVDTLHPTPGTTCYVGKAEQGTRYCLLTNDRVLICNLQSSLSQYNQQLLAYQKIQIWGYSDAPWRFSFHRK